ncbi:class I SAM-dependent methyltransferase [Sphingorhabdus sp.]|jgi:S-adenosylmethionine-diacylgycerolhomoserine-N-methlytransferase|uniref:class I SAM-dependent methyltransferase n=1 Tax=Sphingorhabdus sp. TaxID=1902408 RepID=UPI002BFEC106|nr:class I SAM-dependent methyltransferase [Sphingorhabdus sp.]HMT41331.1 class I SAM-dependent methyltransferase [Sphingorhabdus sp.]
MATTFGNDHAGLMDNIYRGQRHIYDVTRKYYLLGRDRLIDGLDVPHGGTVLEIGCGTGRNLIKIARHWPECRLYGLDISSEMLKSAEVNIRHSAMGERIQMAQGDATGFDSYELFGRRRFDRIVCSYSLSMIPDWQAAVRWALTLLAPQGSLHIVDFGMQQDMPKAFRALLFRWLQIFHVAPRDDMAEYADALARTLQLDFKCEKLFRDYSRIITIG